MQDVLCIEVPLINSYCYAGVARLFLLSLGPTKFKILHNNHEYPICAIPTPTKNSDEALITTAKELTVK